jgi:hypothetical protein
MLDLSPDDVSHTSATPTDGKTTSASPSKKAATKSLPIHLQAANPSFRQARQASLAKIPGPVPQCVTE